MLPCSILICPAQKSLANTAVISTFRLSDHLCQYQLLADVMLQANGCCIDIFSARCETFEWLGLLTLKLKSVSQPQKRSEEIRRDQYLQAGCDCASACFSTISRVELLIFLRIIRELPCLSQVIRFSVSILRTASTDMNSGFENDLGCYQTIP